MIRHADVFRLKHPPGSPAEDAFLAAAKGLAAIPGVETLELLGEVSPKNDYAFCLAMAFADQAAYDAYNAHPAHVAFVRDLWLPEVEAFMEIDTVPL
jgi:hypothetical protein